MQTEMFPIEVHFSGEFHHNVKHLAKKYRSIRKDLSTLVDELTHGQTPGDRLKGVEPFVVYKVRLKNTDLNKGPSAGYRIIYCVADTAKVVLLSIYSKTEQADVSTKLLMDIIKEEKIIPVDAPDVNIPE